jgi:hypothetical protein
MEEWWTRSSSVSFDLTDGLVRAVAEIIYGEQSEYTVGRSRAWLQRRATVTSRMILEELARELWPRVFIEKSPSMVYNIESMQRAFRYFPDARFIHLVRHPSSYGRSVLRYLELLGSPQYQPPGTPEGAAMTPVWIETLASFPYASDQVPAYETRRERVDPQAGWYVLNRNVVTFLAEVPPDQSIRVRGEDVVAHPTETLSAIVRWLGCEVDEKVLNEMQHPERSPFASFGPPGARLGNDILFLENPRLRVSETVEESLDDPMPWRGYPPTFLPEVRDMAREFGYE